MLVSVLRARLSPEFGRSRSAKACTFSSRAAHDDPGVLGVWRAQIQRYLEGRRLRLHPRKTVILRTDRPSVFLGFELRPGTRISKGFKTHSRRRLPEDNVARFRGRLRGLRDRWRAGKLSAAEVEAKINAWVAHAEHADTWQLRQAIFAGGWFDPKRKMASKK